MTEAWGIVFALAAVLALGALLPLRIDAAVVLDGLRRRWRVRVRVGTAGGIVLWRLRLRSGGPSPPAGGGRGRAPRRRRRRRTPGRAVRAASAALRAVRFRRAALEVELGDADAALTAIGCGAAWALGGALLAALPGLGPADARLCVRPFYGGRGRLLCRAEVEAHLRLWQAAAVAVRLAR